MAPLAYIIIGLLVGLLVRVTLPVDKRMGFIPTLLVGMVGGVFGGMAVGSIDPEPQRIALQVPSLLGALLVALVAVVVVTVLNRQRAHA